MGSAGISVYAFIFLVVVNSLRNHLSTTMPPPSNSPALHLKILPNQFRIFKLEPSAPFPLALLGVVQKPSTTEFMSITRNSEEVSVVTDHVFLKSDELRICNEGEKWRCIRVQGPMEHSETLTLYYEI